VKGVGEEKKVAAFPLEKKKDVNNLKRIEPLFQSCRVCDE